MESRYPVGRRRTRGIVAIPLLAWGALSCGVSDAISRGTVCTTEARAAISVALVDDGTGATAPFTGVSIVAEEGTYRDSMYVGSVGTPPPPMGLAYERAGSYVVRVRATGYQLWVSSPQVVTKDACHVQGRLVTARLAR